MRILYFDCFSGISGDMTVGALLDLGVSEKAFLNELDKLGMEGYEAIISNINKNGINGTDFFILSEKNNYQNNCFRHIEKRGLGEIERIIDNSALSERVKAFSKDVYREIGAAEAKVHGKSIYDVHFHEVGQTDSIMEIVGTGICLELLNVEKIFSSVLRDGSGYIKCSHGIMPVPVPAVLQMLAGSGIPLISENVGTELITPTGMGLIKCMASSFGSPPPMIVEKIGYGFGKRDTGRLAALRVTMGETFNELHFNQENSVGFDAGFTAGLCRDIICSKCK